MEHLWVWGSAVLLDWDVEMTKGRWMSGDCRHLAALGCEKRLEQEQEAESWGRGVL